MEGQGNKEFSREPVSSKDALSDANRLRRYALSALRHIEKESKRNPQSGHPISFLGRIASNPDILQFLYYNNQGLALEHKGTRVTYSVIKDPEDPKVKRLIIQGLGFNRVRGRTIDIEWLKEYGSMNDRSDIRDLAKLTREDVIRSFRRAIIERYDPHKYTTNDLSILRAVGLGINKIAEVSGGRRISGAVSDAVADRIADRKYRIQRERAMEDPSDKLRREERGKVMKKVTLAVGSTVLAGVALAGGVKVYNALNDQPAGIVERVVDKNTLDRRLGVQPTPTIPEKTPAQNPTPETVMRFPIQGDEVEERPWFVEGYRKLMSDIEEDGAVNGYYFVNLGPTNESGWKSKRGNDYKVILFKEPIQGTHTFILLTENGPRMFSVNADSQREINEAIDNSKQTGDNPASSTLSFYSYGEEHTRSRHRINSDKSKPDKRTGSANATPTPAAMGYWTLWDGDVFVEGQRGTYAFSISPFRPELNEVLSALVRSKESANSKSNPEMIDEAREFMQSFPPYKGRYTE